MWCPPSLIKNLIAIHVSVSSSQVSLKPPEISCNSFINPPLTFPHLTHKQSQSYCMANPTTHQATFATSPQLSNVSPLPPADAAAATADCSGDCSAGRSPPPPKRSRRAVGGEKSPRSNNTPRVRKTATPADPNKRDSKGLTPLIKVINSATTASDSEAAATGGDATRTTSQTSDGHPTPPPSTADTYCETIGALISAGANVNQRGEKGTTPLLCAVNGGHVDIAELLVKAGARVNSRGADGLTALLLAVSLAGNSKNNAPYLAIVRELINARDEASGGDELSQIPRTDLNATNMEGRTALHIAAISNTVEIIQLLLDANSAHPTHRLDLNAEDFAGCTPLMLAARFGADESFHVLLAAGADPRTEDRQLANAIPHALHSTAACGEHPAIIRALIEAGVDVNSKEKRRALTPLMQAARRGHLQTVEALLAGGADASAKEAATGRSALMCVAEYSPLSQDHNLPCKIAQALIAGGSDVNARDKEGRTPLVVFATNNTSEVMANTLPEEDRVAIINALIAAGAELDTVSTNRNAKRENNAGAENVGSAAMTAAINTHMPGVATALLTAGATPTASMLFHAALKGQTAVVRKIISSQSEVGNSIRQLSLGLGVATLMAGTIAYYW